MLENKLKISIVMEHSHDAEELFDLLVELKVSKARDMEYIDYNREIVIESFTESEKEADEIIEAYRKATHSFVYDSDIVLEEFTASNSKVLFLDSSDFKKKPKLTRLDMINQLMVLRKKNWTREDIVSSYEDEWDEIPETLEECFERMEEYISHTYDDALIKDCIKDEL